MNFNAPLIIDKNCKAQQIYELAIELGRRYCPEWANLREKTPDPDDLGIVLLKLFSKLTETVIGQVNRIPEKHLLAFYDFIGIDHMPPAAAKAPLTFELSGGSKQAFVPERTKVSSSEDPTVIFETIEPLTAVNFKIKSAYSINPWEDKYADHCKDIKDRGKDFYKEDGFYIFDGKEPIPHILYIADEAFDFRTPANVKINFSFSNFSETFKEYFSEISDATGNQFSPTGTFPVVSLEKILISRTVIDGIEGNWISFKPIVTLEGLKTTDLPEINGITCDITADDIIPDTAFFNDTPVDVKTSFYPFGETPKVGDAFYLACDEAFSKSAAQTSIAFNISFDNSKGSHSADLNLEWEYLEGAIWKPLTLDDASKKYKFTTTETISFECPSIKISTLHGITSRWIRVRVSKGDYGKPGHYEMIKPIDEIINAVSIPKAEIANTLSAAKAEVIAELQKERIVIPEDKADVVFKPFKINPGKLSENIENTIIKKYREDLITQLGKEGITSGFIYKEPTHNPPLINSLTIDYSYENKKIQYCRKYNNFEYENVAMEYKDEILKESFNPYLPAPENVPAFYIGFDECFKNKPVSLYFSQKSILYGDVALKIKNPDAEKLSINEKIQGVVWKYHNGKEWVEFGVEDDTELFTKSGFVKFIIPFDISKNIMFGEELFWIKVELKDSSWFEPPKLRGIFPNTVWAENAVFIENELLGSSNGQSAQAFNFSSKSLLEKQVIEVKEPGMPSEEELKEIEPEGSDDAVRLLRNDSGDVQEVWVRWQEVKTFVLSKPLSRHYIVDRVNGKLIFGDGVNGMIPPALPNNIVARKYKSGGGRKGNKETETIKCLQTTIPNIDSVTNHDSASGGKDLELIKNILERAPYSIKNSGRGVTTEDFEWLAKEASAEVAKTRCIKEQKDIKIIIAPNYEDGSLYPQASLIDCVETYLKERAFAPIKSDINVFGPEYKDIDIETKIVPVSSAESAIVADRVERKLKEFLHPITGRKERTGWEFGQDVFISEIAAEIEDVEGINYITELTLKKKDKFLQEASIGRNMLITIEDNELPSAGNIKVSSEKVINAAAITGFGQ